MLNYTSKVNDAYKKFTSKNYYDSLVAYSDISKEIGQHLFDCNIKICEKRCKKNCVNIVYITDEKYAMPTYVSVFSIIKNRNKKLKYKIYVLAQNISSQILRAFESLSMENISIEVMVIDDDYCEFTINKKGFHVSTAAILKFNLPYLFKNLDKILYLDSDIIVQKDIASLFYNNIDQYYAGVVKDIKPIIKYRPSILIKLGIENHSGYFNSGMMLLNLKKIREDNISERLFDYRKNGINYFMDQDAFNVVFNDNVKYLDIKYNFLITLLNEFSIGDLKKIYRISKCYIDINDIVKSSLVIHFASKNKPWNSNQVNFSYLFDFYFIFSKAYKLFEINHSTSCINNIIISLTSYPARINNVHICIKSLLEQSFKAYNIILWLAEEEFPHREKNLPKELLELKDEGLDIFWCKDIKSYKKLIFALKKYPENIIVTADDDMIYHKDWLLQLVISYMRNPEVIHCHRAHSVRLGKDGKPMPYRDWVRSPKKVNISPSFLNFFTGVGGVLYPPHSLANDVSCEDLFMKLSPTGDDIWFWAMALLHGTKIQRVCVSDFSLNFVENTQKTALHKLNDQGGQNDVMVRQIIEYYPELVELLNKVRY